MTTCCNTTVFVSNVFKTYRAFNHIGVGVGVGSEFNGCHSLYYLLCNLYNNIIKKIYFNFLDIKFSMEDESGRELHVLIHEKYVCE